MHTLSHTLAGRQKSEKRSPTRPLWLYDHFVMTVSVYARHTLAYWQRMESSMDAVAAAAQYGSVSFAGKHSKPNTIHAVSLWLLSCRHCCRRRRFASLLICHANISWHFNFRIQLVFVTTHRCVNVQTHMCRRRIAIQNNQKKKRRRKKHSHFSI